MAKVNLLTIHWGLSYGAVLQTYATCRVLERHGHKVSVINIINPKQKESYKSIRAVFCAVMEWQFHRFKRKYFSGLTKKMYSLDMPHIESSDYIVVGSDQVWNRALTSPLELTFFVDFDSDIKKISLSSSFGKQDWHEDEGYSNKVKSLLDKFSAVSVREETGQNLLKTKFNRTAEVLIDPTLALDNYEELILDNKPRNSIYTFFINRRSQYTEIVNQISDSLDVPIFYHSKFTYYFKNSPQHWLTYIKNSSVIITDSFHGVVFSILFEKQFFVICGEEDKFTRIKNLLNLLGLNDRYVLSVEDYKERKGDLEKGIDYYAVNDILKVERERFADFIKHNII